MYLAEQFYRKILKKEPPYYAKYSIYLIFWKPIRKYLNVVIIPNIPFSSLRVASYRLIGFNIGKNVFIGMKCYMDDVAINKTIIEEGVVISYGCYFACHGLNQEHTHIIIKKNAYIGMQSKIISGENGITIEENVIIGAGSLVNKDIPNGATAVGIPIRILDKEINNG